MFTYSVFPKTSSVTLSITLLTTPVAARIVALDIILVDDDDPLVSCWLAPLVFESSLVVETELKLELVDSSIEVDILN